METPRHSRLLLACALMLAGAAASRAADFELTPLETARLSRGEVITRASLDVSQRRGTVRAALFIDAPPATVFEVMTRCADAMAYVPHLRSCRVRGQSADSRTRLIEQEIDLGWYAPRIRYVLRAEMVLNRSIAFRQVSGDFKANQGIWELEPSGAGTLLRYRAEIDPPGFVPSWLARASFKRELPRLLTGLRQHCEAGRQLAAQANIRPF
jgi:hypothetical protein